MKLLRLSCWHHHYFALEWIQYVFWWGDGIENLLYEWLSFVKYYSLNNLEYKPIMAYLQASQLCIDGEDSWWQLFDLVIIQVPLKRIYP